MKTFTVTLEVKGYRTVQVQARSKKAATEKALEQEWAMPVNHLEDLSWKAEVESSDD